MTLSAPLKRALVNECLAQGFSAFNRRSFEELHNGQALERNWHHDAIAHALREITRGNIKRLLITMPPRSLKSLMVSVAFPAWFMGQDPSQKVICTSYSDPLAVAFANQWRQVVTSPWYRGVFDNVKISPIKDREGETQLTKGGYRISVSAGGTLTGRGGDLIIVDDPMKPADASSEVKRVKLIEWFDQTVVTRLNNKLTGVIIVVMQRLHPQDLAGHLIAQGGWTHLNLPAISPVDQCIALGGGRFKDWPMGEPLQVTREPLGVLDDLKRQMGTAAFSAQYLQTPVPSGGNMIKLNWFGRYGPDDITGGKGELVISIDTASSTSVTADYSALLVWRKIDQSYYLIDALRGKWEYPVLRQQAINLAERYNHPRLLIEQAGSGFALTDDLRKAGFNPIRITPKGSKEQRLAKVIPIIEAGRVYLPKAASWLPDFEHEIAAFPAGKNDDWMDAMTQYLNWGFDRKISYSDLRPMRISHC